MKNKTNLEKKTELKIANMTNNDTLTMDFILKNKKMLQHIRHCRVMLPKGGKNKPIKRLRNKPDKKESKTETNSSSKTAATTSEKRSQKRSAEQEDRNHKPKKAKKSASPTEPETKPKTSGKPVRIFIKLPTVNKLGKIVKTPERNGEKKSANKKQNALGKTYLREKFGNKVFCCEVRVKRLYSSSDKRKKSKANRKTVSFVETVEVFGDSGTEYESEEEENEAMTSTPINPEASKRVTRRSLNGEKKNKRRGRISIAMCKTGSDEEQSITDKTNDEEEVVVQEADDESINIEKTNNKDISKSDDQLDESKSSNTETGLKSIIIDDDSSSSFKSIERDDTVAPETESQPISPVRNGEADFNNQETSINCNLDNISENEEIETESNGHDNTITNTIPLPNSTTNSTDIPNSDIINEKHINSDKNVSESVEVESNLSEDLVYSGVTDNSETCAKNSTVNNDEDTSSFADTSSFSLNTFFKTIKNKIMPATPPTPSNENTLNSSSI